MSALVELTQFGARTNSRIVAEVFEKEHKDVLRAIDNVIEHKPELRGRNFTLTQDVAKIGVATRTIRSFEMDRDGFTLVAMGFTGAKALDWKLAFIDAFNRMEEALRADRGEVDAEPMVMRDYSPALAVIREARQIFSPMAVRALWPRLGLPDPTSRDARLVEAEHNGNAEFIDQTMIDWRNACTVDEEGAVTSAADLWESYSRWCDDAGRVPANRNRFGRAVAGMGYALARHGGGFCHRVGIKLVG